MFIRLIFGLLLSIIVSLSVPSEARAQSWCENYQSTSGLYWVECTKYACPDNWDLGPYVDDPNFSGCYAYTGYCLAFDGQCCDQSVNPPSCVQAYTCCAIDPYVGQEFGGCYVQSTPCTVDTGTGTGGGTTPANGNGSCNDGICNGAETCSTCALDCGACAITGAGRARAVIVPSDTTSCADVIGSTNYLAASFGLTPPNSVVNTAADGSYATWSVPISPSGTVAYLSTSVASQYVQKLACWSRDNPAGSGTGTAATFTADGSTITWTVGYTLGAPWFQAEGGDVYASGTLRSYVSPGATPRVFVNDGSGGYPGMVMFNSSYDFDSSLVQGNGYVSSTNWLAYAPHTTVDYYDYFYRRFGSPTTPYAFTDLLAVAQPDSSETPYYVVGDMTTSGDWLVGDGESVIFIVDGNVTIGGSINTTGSGFVAFIVNGNITVDTSVGVAYNSSVSVLDGIYITSPTGTFTTGTTTAAASARFVGEGMFIAGDFLLQRDLEGYGTGNTTHAAELFVYDPQLLFTMPDPMKELPVTWQEVAP